MGLSCKIHKRGNIIDVVEAPNSEPSKLFDDAFKMVKSKKKALKIWAVAYTKKFNDFFNKTSIINPLPSKSNKLKVMDNYNGIFSDSTNIVFYDDIFNDNVQNRKGYMYFYKGLKSEIKLMPPSEYLKKVRDGFKTNKDEGITDESKLSIRDGISKGNKIDIPYLNYAGNFAQEGRNRVTVAKELGEKVIPVMVINKVTFEDKVNTGREILNNLILNYSFDNNEELMGKFKELHKPHRDMSRFIRDEVLPLVNINNDVSSFSKNINTDINGEPLLKDVLHFLESTNLEKLNNKDKLHITNNLYGSNVNSINELYITLKDTFFNKDNEFTINKELLQKSKLYTDVEISNILSNNNNVQSEIKKFISKVEQSFILDDNFNIDVVGVVENNIVNPNSIIGIGKFEMINPFIIEKDIASSLAGIHDRELFEVKIHEINYESIIDKYFSDKDYADTFFDKYSNMKKLRVLKIVNGNLSDSIKDDTFTTLSETLVGHIDNRNIRLNVNFLDGVSEDIWDSSEVEVKSVLKDISKHLLNYNVDVIGLENLYNTHSINDIKDFIYDLYEFTNTLNNSSVGELDIKLISEKIDNKFGNTKENDTFITTVDINNDNNSLVKLNIADNITELSIFNKFNLIKTVDENIYHKVNVIKDINELYDTLHYLILNDNSLLPNEAYYPTGFDADGTINKGKIQSIDNKADIISDIKRYFSILSSKSQTNFENIDGIEKLLIYKTMFGHPINNTNYNIVNFTNNYYNFKGNFDYLSDRFISDFRNIQLTEKFKGSLLYNKVLSNFKIDEKGISMLNDDVITKNNTNLLADKVLDNLKQYSYISKDDNLNNLFTKKSYSITKDSKINLYKNNPLLINKYQGIYKIDNNILVAKNSIDEFIRVKEGLFTKVTSDYGTSVYKNIKTFKHSNLNNFSKENLNVKSTNLKFDNIKIDENISTNELYSNIELNDINEKIDSCEG